jgi:hypothetical protein
MAQKQTFGNHESCWIRYQLDLRSITQREVAKKANRSLQLVSLVIRGERRSNNVEAALSQMLGFKTFKELIEAARSSTQGEGVA